MSSSQWHHEPEHSVHPRWVWSGVAVAIAGMVLAGVEMMIGTTTWTLAGAAVIVTGLVVAWRGGIMYSVHANKSLHQEVSEVVHGDVHEGISPSDQGHRHATSPDKEPQGHQRVQWPSAPTPTPALAPLGVIGLLVLACWLLVGRWIVSYPKTAHGYTNGEYDLAFAIILALSAIWMRQIGPNKVMTGVSGLCGILLITLAFALPHDASGVEWNEVVVGILVVLCARVTLDVEPHGHRATGSATLHR
jgi:hypothetical protein